MRKISCAILLLAAFHLSAHSQGLYKKGVIVTKSKDSLKCYVLLEPDYIAKVHYKYELMAEEEYSLPVKTVKSIITENKYLENVLLGKKEKMLHLSVAGKDSLFYYIDSKETFRGHAPGVTTSASSMTTRYFLKKEGKHIEIDFNNFNSHLQLLLSDCTAIVDRLKKNSDNYQDIPNIIQEYNSCN